MISWPARWKNFDWLHLHHEDFTGQYGKFYAAFRNQLWYRQDVEANEALAKKLGYHKVSEMKRDVVKTINDYVRRGGFHVCHVFGAGDIRYRAGGAK